MTTRTIVILALLIDTVGCASKPAVVERPRPLVPPQPASVSLAFTPTVARDVGALDLDREGRQTVAYAGYERQVESVTYTVQDDRQRSNRFGTDQSTFERRSVSTTVTVRGN